MVKSCDSWPAIIDLQAAFWPNRKCRVLSFLHVFRSCVSFNGWLFGLFTVFATKNALENNKNNYFVLFEFCIVGLFKILKLLFSPLNLYSFFFLGGGGGGAFASCKFLRTLFSSFSSILIVEIKISAFLIHFLLTSIKMQVLEFTNLSSEQFLVTVLCFEITF